MLRSSGDDGPSAADKDYLCTTGLACFKLVGEACSRVVQMVEGTLGVPGMRSHCSGEQVTIAETKVANGSAKEAVEAHNETEENRKLDDAGLAVMRSRGESPAA